MWVNSKDAAEILGVKYDALQKATRRSEKAGKKFCTIKFHKLYFEYINGRGGASGKVLQIWIDDAVTNDDPSKKDLKNEKNSLNRGLDHSRGSDSTAFCSAVDSAVSDGYIMSGNDERSGDSCNLLCGAQACEKIEAKSASQDQNLDEISGASLGAKNAEILCAGEGFEKGELKSVKINEISSEFTGTNGANFGAQNLPLIAVCSDKKRKEAFEKYEIIKAWERAKNKLTATAFIDYTNANGAYSLKISANKLYDWQRKFKNGGLDGLVDERTNRKKLTLEALGLKEYAINVIHAQAGRINIQNIYNLINYEAINNGKLSLEAFNGRRDEVVSYDVVSRFVKNYLAKNRLLKNLILYGEDGVVGRQMPALGRSNWAVTSINQVVEIDASPLDLICNASDICEMIGFKAVNNVFKDKDEFESYVREWQKRYTIISLIDTYSGVATFSISDSENSVAIARAVAKYILRYGKPKVIKGDNGKAFRSEYSNSVMNALEIEYKAVRAYSGWLKPYVERNFRALQHNFTANLAGFIGHNITQRQAIEFFFSKKERRLKKGEKTNLSRLKSLMEVQNLMDLYAEKFLNSRYLERLDKTCAEAFNEKIADAQYMDALSLSARLGKRELKHVTKKGIHVDGVWFYNVAMFEFERVIINKNINNISECFVWSETGEFIGVASTLDLENGQSAEVAKASQKLFAKRLKETKKQMQSCAFLAQGAFEQIVNKAQVKTALSPEQKSANNESKLISAALSEAGNLNSNSPLDESITRKSKPAKKIRGWDEIVCG